MDEIQAKGNILIMFCRTKEMCLFSLRQRPEELDEWRNTEISVWWEGKKQNVWITGIVNALPRRSMVSSELDLYIRGLSPQHLELSSLARALVDVENNIILENLTRCSASTPHFYRSQFCSCNTCMLDLVLPYCIG